MARTWIALLCLFGAAAACDSTREEGGAEPARTTPNESPEPSKAPEPEPERVEPIVARPSDGGAPVAGPGGMVSGRVVSERGLNVPGTVAYLVGASGDHEAPTSPVTIDQREMQFVPRVIAVLAGTTVEFLNGDSTEHNVYSPDNEGYDLGKWRQGESRSHRFDRAGVYTQLCKIHPNMRGTVVVRDNPWFAVVGDDGRFRIEHVPAGRYPLELWNERRGGPPVEVIVADGAETAVDVPLVRRRRR